MASLEILDFLEKEKVLELLDPSAYTGLASGFVDEVLAEMMARQGNLEEKEKEWK